MSGDLPMERKNTTIVTHGVLVQQCTLCAAVAGVAPKFYPASANKILVETNSFVVMPTVGPLVAGHVLVVTKSHSLGLFPSDPCVWTEYEGLARRLRQHCTARGHDLLELEHGGSTGGHQGPCITHAHVHIMPRLGRLVDVLGTRFPRHAPLREVTDAARNPYVWSRNGKSEYWYDASDAMGQESRRAIGRAIGRDDWDWAVSPKWDIIEQSISYWLPLD
jgi:diadenosine tetraphosphate (Ap4A) HIT family hydrolase